MQETNALTMDDHETAEKHVFDLADPRRHHVTVPVSSRLHVENCDWCLFLFGIIQADFYSHKNRLGTRTRTT